MKTQQIKQNPGYLIAMLSALILSTTGIFIAYLSNEFSLPPLVLSFWRELLVSLVLLIYLLIRNPCVVDPKGKDFSLLIPPMV